jgi:uncharacterized protein (DUF2336 family)
MSDHLPLVAAAIARLVGEDPLAPRLLAAAAADHPDSFDALAALAAVSDPFEDAVAAARDHATTRRQRQHLAIVESWREGASDRAHFLAREHLAEFPDDVLVSWLTTKI